MSQDPKLAKAWSQYQDLFDRYMALLYRISIDDDIEAIRMDYQRHIDYAVDEWSSDGNKRNS